MPILALSTVLALVQDGRAAHDLLPFAPPSVGERFVAAADVAGVGEAWVVVADADGARLVRLADGGFTPVGDAVAFASGQVGSAQGFDLDRDGRASVFAVDGERLVELALDHRGRFGVVGQLDLPGEFRAFVAPGICELDVPGVGAVALHLVIAEGVLALRPLWSGTARGFACLASGAVVALDERGAAWLVAGAEVRALEATARFAAVVDGAWLVGSDGGLFRPVESLVRDASGAAQLDVRLQPLVVDGGFEPASFGRLFDIDEDGDLELVSLSAGALFVRDGWGATGVRAPQPVPTFGVSLTEGAFEVLRADGRVWALAPQALAPLDTSTAHATATTLDAPLASLDVDRDGDLDLVAGGTYLVNDGAGGFTPLATSHLARTLLVVEQPLQRTLLFDDATGCFEQLVRADGSLGALREFDMLSSLSGFTLANAHAVDLDGDGDDELVTPEHVFSRPWSDDEFGFRAVTPLGFVAALERRADGSAALLVHDAAHGALSLAHLVGTEFRLEPLAPIALAQVDAALLVADATRELLVVAGAGRLVVFDLASSAATALVDVALPNAPVAALASLAPDAPNRVAVSFEHGQHQHGQLALVDLASGALVLRHGPRSPHWCDVDGDGDLDLVAPQCGIVRGERHDGAAGGAILQYGGGAPGSGDLTPLLGVRGPARLVEPRPQLRVVGGLGGAKLYLAVTPDDWVLDLRRFGLSIAEQPRTLTWIDAELRGDDGVAGAGHWEWTMNFAPGLVGRTLRAQAFIADPRAVDGVSVSNRIAVTFGG